MPEVKLIDILESYEMPKTLYDALRYVFISLSDFCFERLIKTFCIESDGETLLPKDNLSACYYLKIKDIIGISSYPTCMDEYGHSIYIINISKADLSSLRLTIQAWSDKNFLPMVANRFFCYCLANDILPLSVLEDTTDAWEYILKELNDDIQKYNRTDIIEGCVKFASIEFFISLCQKYNYLELLMIILNLMKDKDKLEASFSL